MADLSFYSNVAEILGTLTIIGGAVFGAVQLLEFRGQRRDAVAVELMRSFYNPEFSRSVTLIRNLPDDISADDLRVKGPATEEAALLFYYLNRTAYNGLCRFNSRGEFNVPFGRYKTINYATNFVEYKAMLASWRFMSGDFSTIPLADADFIYADPPYDVEFTTYSAGGFSWEDQVRAATFLAEHSGPVVLVNQATRRIKELYRDLGYKLRFLDAPRRISCTGDRTPAREVLATRNLGEGL